MGGDCKHNGLLGAVRPEALQVALDMVADDNGNHSPTEELHQIIAMRLREIGDSIDEDYLIKSINQRKPTGSMTSQITSWLNSNSNLKRCVNIASSAIATILVESYKPT